MNNMEQALQALESIPKLVECSGVNTRRAILVGSVPIQGEGNDIDVLVQINSADCLETVRKYLDSVDWDEQTGDEAEYGTGDFVSFRLADINCLIVWDDVTFDNWSAAVEVCKYIRTADRNERVAIHQIVMDGHSASDIGHYFPPFGGQA